MILFDDKKTLFRAIEYKENENIIIPRVNNR